MMFKDAPLLISFLVEKVAGFSPMAVLHSV